VQLTTNLGMDIRAVVGLNVLRVRRERNLSQEELSHRSGLTRAYLSGLEAGRRNPTVVSLSRLAEALGVDETYLVSRANSVASRCD